MKELPMADTKTAAIVSEYKRVRPLYVRLVTEVQHTIEKEITFPEIKVAGISGRAKTGDSFEEKLRRERYANPLEDITDLAGVRIVCYYESDLQLVNAGYPTACGGNLTVQRDDLTRLAIPSYPRQAVGHPACSGDARGLA